MTSADDVASRGLRTDVKSCCAAFYGNEWVHRLLGASFHPGGLSLTSRLGAQLNLGPSSHLLDVASGRGATAIHLVQTFGCRVTGIDLSQPNIDEATRLALSGDRPDHVSFVRGDAEALPFPDEQFDAIICECALCTFPDKPAACSEFTRVLKPGGMVGISDVTRNGELPEMLAGVLAAAACIADARPVAGYVNLLENSGLEMQSVERHDNVLNDLLNQIRIRLLSAKVLTATSDFDLSGLNIHIAQDMIRSAAYAIQNGTLGYATFVAAKPRRASMRRNLSRE